MFYPFRSYILAILLYIFLIIFLGINFRQDFVAPLVSLEIEAEAIGDSNQHQHNSSFVNNETTQKIAVADAINKSEHQHFDPNINHDKKSSQNHSQQALEAKKIAPIFQPLPEIPEDLRYDFFATEIVAKFFIAKSGEVYNVELISPSDIPRLNMALIKSLMKWRFPTQDNEKTEIIRVKFEVREKT